MMNTGRLSSTHQPTNQCQRSGYLYKALFYNKNTDLSIYLHMQHLPSTNRRHIQNLLAGQTGGPCRGAKQHIMPVVNIQLIQLLELAAGTFCFATWLNFANSRQSSWAGIGLFNLWHRLSKAKGRWGKKLPSYGELKMQRIQQSNS